MYNSSAGRMDDVHAQMNANSPIIILSFVTVRTIEHVIAMQR